MSASRTASPPRIDGYLNDDVWRSVEPISDFTQLEPDEGKPATERTEVRLLYDDGALYFGCMMYDTEPNRIVARLTRRDNEIESDVFSIRIDSYHDHQSCFEFTILASGTKVDIVQYNDAADEDDSWDAVWEVETKLLKNGWSAEVKIPFNSLRFSQTEEWGINLKRFISRKQESDYWVMIPKSETGFVSRFGHLNGLKNIPAPSRMEILPYGVSKFLSEPSATRPIATTDLTPSAGFDLKYGLSRNLTLDATVNPDFGQVEADPAVLNLTTFETFYPEKRPFFIEGAHILNFTTFGGKFGPGLFYSRRIGRVPSLAPATPPDGFLEDLPSATTIAGAVKITGKTENGLAIGILDALTSEETARFVDSAWTRTSQIVEPRSNYALVRVKQDIWENSVVGGIMTCTARKGGPAAFTGGLDWKLRFEHSTYAISGFLAGSSTVQNTDRREGAAGKIFLAKEGGQHWLYSGSSDFTSKQYYVNDLGFFFRPNDWGFNTDITYKEDKPGTVIRRYSFENTGHIRWNFDRVPLYRESGLIASFTFLNYWALGLEYNRNFGVRYDDRETRGNGLYELPNGWSARASMWSDNRHAVIGECSVFRGGDSHGGSVISAQPELTLRPASNIDLSFGFGYERTRHIEAWIYNTSLPLAPVASIFGDRDTDRWDFTSRGTFTFTRDLTLQLYAQVFLAKGHYANLRQLVTPGTFLPVQGLPGADFNDQAFVLNVVWRWEYMAGSTVYLVWTQARNGQTLDYYRSFGQSLKDTFRAPSTNVVLLKFSYWWSV